MAITKDDINLDKFTKLFTTTTDGEAAKEVLSDADYFKIASLLKILNKLQHLRIK